MTETIITIIQFAFLAIVSWQAHRLTKLFHQAVALNKEMIELSKTVNRQSFEVIKKYALIIEDYRMAQWASWNLEILKKEVK